MTAATSFFVAFLLASSAMAQATASTNQAAYEQAKREHRLGNYDAAATAFGELYRQTGDPTMLFNRGQSLRLAGKGTEALAAYRSYLRDRPDAPNRAMVEAKIKELEDEAKRPAAVKPKAKRTKTELELFDPMLDDAFKPKPSSVPKAPATATTPPPLIVQPQPIREAKSPIWKRWWLWTAVGVAVAGGTAAVVMSNRDGGPPSTPLGNQGIF